MEVAAQNKAKTSSLMQIFHRQARRYTCKSPVQSWLYTAYAMKPHAQQLKFLSQTCSIHK